MANTVLISVDFMDIYKGDKNISEPKWRAMCKRVESLTQQAEQNNIPIIHVIYAPIRKMTFVGEEPGQIFGTYAEVQERLITAKGFPHELRPAINVTDHSLMAVKTMVSACSNQSLMDYLGEQKVKNIILVGMYKRSTDKKTGRSCVSESGEDFLQAGYNVVIASEGTNCFDLPLRQRKAQHDFRVLSDAGARPRQIQFLPGAMAFARYGARA